MKIQNIDINYIVIDKLLIYKFYNGGFIFGAADFTAMAAVNDPFVVLAKSETKFLAPVRVNESVLFEGTVIQNDGKKFTVEVVGSVGNKKVFTGIFYTVVLDKHVLCQ